MNYEYSRDNLGSLPELGLDCETIRQNAIARIPAKAPRWTDRNPSGIEMALLELACWCAAQVHGYLNVRSRNAYLRTATLRDNVHDIVDVVGYRPAGVKGATTTLRITLPRVAVTGVTIPKYWQASGGSSSDQKWAVTTEEAYIAPGQLTVDVPAMEGRRYSTTQAGTGEADQIILIASGGVSAADVLIAGEDWPAVDTFVGQEEDAEVHTRRTLWDGTTEIAFGDDAEGACPPVGEDIAVTYILSSGASANGWAVGIIDTPVDALYDGATPVAPVVESLEAFEGGADAETIAKTKRSAPRVTHALHRMVAGNDERSMIEALPGIARATVLDLNNTVSGYKVNLMGVRVVASGGGAMSRALRAEVEDLIEENKIGGTDHDVADADRVDIDLDMTLYRQADASDGAVSAAASALIAAYFSEDMDVALAMKRQYSLSTIPTDFGKAFVPDHLRALVEKIEGMAYAVVNTPPATVPVGSTQFPRLRSLKLTVIE